MNWDEAAHPTLSLSTFPAAAFLCRRLCARRASLEVRAIDARASTTVSPTRASVVPSVALTDSDSGRLPTHVVHLAVAFAQISAAIVVPAHSASRPFFHSLGRLVGGGSFAGSSHEAKAILAEVRPGTGGQRC